MFDKIFLVVLLLLFCLGTFIWGIIVFFMPKRNDQEVIDKSLARTTQYMDRLNSLFPEHLCLRYSIHMRDSQPFDNDRILNGRGKKHTLELMVSVSANDVPSILEQIGDVFS